MSYTSLNEKSILYVGQAYYYHWYLSRELRKLGWKADQLNIDRSEDQRFYHGQDFNFFEKQFKKRWQRLEFYLNALNDYEIFHFANKEGIRFIMDYDLNKCKVTDGFVHRLFVFIFEKILKWDIRNISRFIGIKKTSQLLSILLLIFKNHLPYRWDILLLKKLNKRIVYSQNGCHDGVTQTTFSNWSTPDNIPVCDICVNRNKPEICSDENNMTWGKFRNEVADYQCTYGGNRADFNDSPLVHETPWLYCIDPDFWDPDLPVPPNNKLPFGDQTVKIYHAVGNFHSRVSNGNVTIKSTHIYIPLIEQLKAEGHDVELIFFNDVPSKQVRYYQAQADIVVDMLTYGFYGANVREGLMLGKPCVCYLRPEWLENMRKEIPEYVDEIPVVSATPATIKEVLIDLIMNPEKRMEIGRKSREFALKWHSSKVAAEKFDKIYSDLTNTVNA